MCYMLFSSYDLDNVHHQYKTILKEKNFNHQLISGVFSDDKLLGCIDPVYRHGKPLKYLMDSRHMILAMCDSESLSNIDFKNFPSLHEVPSKGCNGTRFKVEEIEMIPIAISQREHVHYTFRPFIEFIQVDTFSPLNCCQKTLMLPPNQNSGLLQEMPRSALNGSRDFQSVWSSSLSLFDFNGFLK